MAQIIRITGAPTKNRPSILAGLFNRVYSKIGAIVPGAIDIDEMMPGKSFYHPNFGLIKITNRYLTKNNTDVIDVILPDGTIKVLVSKYVKLFKTQGESDANIHTPIKFANTDVENSGGGTFFGDYLRQGASNRHLEARADENKLTAGEMAKVLSQILKRKILASDISHLATEWHHAGVFYNKYTKRTSGKKVFFFTQNDINRLTELLR